MAGFADNVEVKEGTDSKRKPKAVEREVVHRNRNNAGKRMFGW